MTGESTSRARVATDRAARYGKQLVTHMTRKVPGVWDEASSCGHLQFGDARVDLTAHPGGLDLLVSCPPDHLDQVEDVVGSHLARFGIRDGLVVAWVRADGTPGRTHGADT